MYVRRWGGTPLRARGAVIEIHGDWSEIVNTFGMLGWNHVARPCFCCTTDLSQLYDLDTINALGWPCELTTAESYESACQRAEIWVWVEQRDFDGITPLLYYSKKDKPAGGRLLRNSYTPLHLEKHDRLESNQALSDVGNF